MRVRRATTLQVGAVRARSAHWARGLHPLLPTAPCAQLGSTATRSGSRPASFVLLGDTRSVRERLHVCLVIRVNTRRVRERLHVPPVRSVHSPIRAGPSRAIRVSTMQ